MKVLLYKGKSIVSKLIKLQTRSQYSHAAMLLDDGSVIEAWQGEGVRRTENPFADHAPGTEIDVYTIDVAFNSGVAEAYLVNRLGNKYDYWSVMRFVTRRDSPHNEKDFCSELVLTALSKAGVELLHGNPSHMSPRDVSISPLLTYEKTIGSTS